MEGRFVTYYRVSTNKQGKSGLGIEAQKKTVENYLNGGTWEVVGEYVEVESGGKSDRPELEKAILDCKLKKARLLVAKLDRLSRDLHFITELQNAGIEFTIAEMPDATELTIHIYAAMAQHERKVIGDRTKNALQAAKVNGSIKGQGFFGNPHIKKGEALPERFKEKGAGNTEEARRVKLEKAADFAKNMTKVIEGLRQEGDSLRRIAQRLNDAGYKTSRGKEWQAASVLRILGRA